MISQDEIMMEPVSIRVGRIQYVNVDPVYYGLEHGLSCPGISYVRKPPAELNRLMAAGDLDISPVSSAAYAKHSDKWVIIPDLSIACNGPVMSVRLFSRQPMEQLDNRKIILTSDSESAMMLLKLVITEKKLSPVYETLPVRGAEDVPPDAAAVLVIGNAALSSAWEETFPYAWDLGGEWKAMTGLPFVFALWAVQREFADWNAERVMALMGLFYMSKEMGIGQIERIARNASTLLGLPVSTCRKYFSCLQYTLDENHRAGLDLFYAKLYDLRLISRRPQLRFFDPHSHFGRMAELEKVGARFSHILN